MLVPGGAVAGEDALFWQGRELYQNLEFEKAIGLLDKALTAESSSARERAGIYAYLGLCHFHLGDEARARAAFSEGLRLDRDLIIPEMTSPKIVAALEEERAKLPAPVLVAAEPAPEVHPAVRTGPLVPDAPAVSAPRWPVYVAGAVAAVLAGTGSVMRVGAEREMAAAEGERYASDAVARSDRALRSARTSNALFGAAAGAAAVAVTFHFVF